MERSEAGVHDASVGPHPTAFTWRPPGRHDLSVESGTSTGRPDANRAHSPEASIPAVRIWGPVPKAQALGAGALAAASSVLLAPQHPPAGLFHRLAALVSDEVLPQVLKRFPSPVWVTGV